MNVISLSHKDTNGTRMNLIVIICTFQIQAVLLVIVSFLIFMLFSLHQMIKLHHIKGVNGFILHHEKV